MTGYFKQVDDGYIVAIQTSNTEEGNITKEEYDRINEAIQSIPKAIEGYEFKLKEDLSIEIIKLEEAD